MTTFAMIILLAFLIGLLINYPGFGVAMFILLTLGFIQEGSHGKLPLADYFVEGFKVLFK